jgi:hypothetical protein
VYDTEFSFQSGFLRHNLLLRSLCYHYDIVGKKVKTGRWRTWRSKSFQIYYVFSARLTVDVVLAPGHFRSI